MTTTAPNPAKRSRWMDWKPARILADMVESEPTKPSKPGSVGFAGAIPAESQEIRVNQQEHAAPWAYWKGVALNRLFEEQGATGKPGRIAAATIVLRRKSFRPNPQSRNVL